MIHHFVCPSALERWDHRSPDGPGIAGSETCVVEISRRLAQRGHDVRVYAQIFDDTPDDVVTTWDGESNTVRWRSVHGDIDLEEGGIWWLCRHPMLADYFKPNPDQVLMLRCDDVHYERPGEPANLTRERCDKFTHILLMSPPHAEAFCSIYPFVPKDKISTLGCAIPTEKIVGMCGIRDKFQIIWPNSPDRGLENAIRILQLARKREPRLHLEVYYGWNGCDAVAAGDPEHPKAKLKRLCTEELDQTNVTYHGRANKDTLWRAFLKSNFWLYPSDFFECGICTAMEAQSLGAIPITNPYSGTGHMVQNGVFIQGDPTDPLIQRRYADALVRLVGDPQACTCIRDDMIPWALKEFAWSNVIDHHERLAECLSPFVIRRKDENPAEVTMLDRWTLLR